MFVRGKCVCVSRARHAHFYVNAVLAVLEVDGVAFERFTRSEVVHLQKRQELGQPNFPSGRRCRMWRSSPCQGNRDTELAILAALRGRGAGAGQTRSAHRRAWPADPPPPRASTVPVPARVQVTSVSVQRVKLWRSEDSQVLRRTRMGPLPLETCSALARPIAQEAW